MRIAVRPRSGFAAGLAVVTASVATVLALWLTGFRPGALAWVVISMTAGFSLSGSV